MHYQLRAKSYEKRLIKILFGENFSFIDSESVKYFYPRHAVRAHNADAVVTAMA